MNSLVERYSPVRPDAELRIVVQAEHGVSCGAHHDLELVEVVRARRIARGRDRDALIPAKPEQERGARLERSERELREDPAPRLVVVEHDRVAVVVLAANAQRIARVVHRARPDRHVGQRTEHRVPGLLVEDLEGDVVHLDVVLQPYVAVIVGWPGHEAGEDGVVEIAHALEARTGRWRNRRAEVELGNGVGGGRLRRGQQPSRLSRLSPLSQDIQAIDGLPDLGCRATPTRQRGEGRGRVDVTEPIALTEEEAIDHDGAVVFGTARRREGERQ